MSDGHFTVDGTLIEAWASLKSFRRKEEKPGDRPPPDDKGNPSVDFHGEKRSNETHESKTDPESRLARKGNGDDAWSYESVLTIYRRIEDWHGAPPTPTTAEPAGRFSSSRPPIPTRSHRPWSRVPVRSGSRASRT